MALNSELFKTPVERLRALARAANIVVEEEKYLPEDLDIFMKQSFYCKFLGRVVTPRECQAHWKQMYGVVQNDGKVFFTRKACIEAYKEPGHELEIKLKVIKEYAEPLSSVINNEVINWERKH